MCFRKIGRKLKGAIEWVTNRGYKFITGSLTAIWMLLVVLNPLFTAILTGLWMGGVAFFTYSWRKTRGSTRWTLGTVNQQVDDWREGRRRRKEAEREKLYGE